MPRSLPTGFSVVTRSALQIKDRSVLPFDRVVASWHQLQDDGTVKVVEGTWGDYLRDLDMQIVVKKQAPLNDAEKTDDVILVTDVFPEGIPDPYFLPDPTLPY